MVDLESRVGFKTISVLKGLVEEYIRVNTLDGLYVVEVKYLKLFEEYDKYLRGDGK